MRKPSPFVIAAALAATGAVGALVATYLVTREDAPSSAPELRAAAPTLSPSGAPALDTRPATPPVPPAASPSRAPLAPPSSGGASGSAMQPRILAVSPPSGATSGGNEVLIRGANFSNPQVLFGQEPAQVRHQSGDLLAVVAPSAAAGATVPVVVTNRSGAYAVAQSAYTYR